MRATKKIASVAVALAVAAALAVTVGLAPAAAGQQKDPNAAGNGGTAAFGRYGPLSGPAGRGSFRFGVSTSATQIEDRNHTTDWYQWTQPPPEGLGKSAPVGEGVGGYTRAFQDVDLVKQTGVDSYRFGIEWARVEPKRGQFDEAALAHYSQEIDALLRKGIRPTITVHHFAMPTWVDDPRDPTCAKGPSSTNLCGLDNPVGGPQIVDEFAKFAGLLAQRYGDRVQDWVTINEPMVYMLFAHGVGAGPPGKAALTTPGGFDAAFTPALRTLLSAHAAAYRAIKRVRPGASVGLANSVKQYVPVRDGKVSQNPADVAAAERFRWFFERTIVESLWRGSFSSKLDGRMDESHPDWRGTLDWLGLQLYDRTGATAQNGAPGTVPVPATGVSSCAGPPCMQPIDPSYWIPEMKYEQNPEALYPVVKRYSQEYPGLPLVASESGIATTNPERRSQFIVRGLEQAAALRADGVDLRGYYYWSLLDNFEWLNGYAPKFGLFSVDRTTMARTPTTSVGVYRQITTSRSVPPEIAARYGRVGPLAPER